MARSRRRLFNPPPAPGTQGTDRDAGAFQGRGGHRSARLNQSGGLLDAEDDRLRRVVATKERLEQKSKIPWAKQIRRGGDFIDRPPAVLEQLVQLDLFPVVEAQVRRRSESQQKEMLFLGQHASIPGKHVGAKPDTGSKEFR